jgi:hypothetical protein
MSEASVESQLRSLEAQIAVLKAWLRAQSVQEPAFKSFGDLYGVLQGKAQSTEQEIQQAEFRFKWQ